jgi:hypothetical protein
MLFDRENFHKVIMYSRSEVSAWLQKCTAARRSEQARESEEEMRKYFAIARTPSPRSAITQCAVIGREKRSAEFYFRCVSRATVARLSMFCVARRAASERNIRGKLEARRSLSGRKVLRFPVLRAENAFVLAM